MILGLSLIPNLAFAAWWNPFTWFNNRPTVQLIATSTVATTSISVQISKTIKKSISQKTVTRTPPPQILQSPITITTSGPSGVDIPNWTLTIQQDGSGDFSSIIDLPQEQAWASRYADKTYPAGTFNTLINLVDSTQGIQLPAIKQTCVTAGIGQYPYLTYKNFIIGVGDCRFGSDSTSVERKIILEMNRISNNIIQGEPMSTMPPLIKSLSPTSGPTGTQIMITGSGFTLINNEIWIYQQYSNIGYDAGSFVTEASSTDGATLEFIFPKTIPDIVNPTQSTTTKGTYFVTVQNVNGTVRLPFTVTNN